MEYRKKAHAVYYAQYHIVISTKYRRKVLNTDMGDYLKRKVLQITKFHPEIEIVEVNTRVDHIHLQMSIPPRYSVCEIVRMVKAHTGSAMRKKFPFLDKGYWGINGIWSIGCFESTVGINEETIRKYIQKQGEEDSEQALLEF